MADVKFAGFIIDQEGNKRDPIKIEALRDFLAPMDLTNFKSYFGLANQQGEFSPVLKHSLEPLKPQLSTKYAYNWNGPLQKAFERSKEVLCSDQVLKRFDPLEAHDPHHRQV